MPRMRFRLPVEVEVTDEELAAVQSVTDAVRKARDVGLPQALADAWDKAALALKSRRPRR